MKREMTLLELQDVLGQRIRMTLRDDLTTEERAEENEQTQIVVGVAKQMINNADIVMRHESLMAKCKGLESMKMDSLIGE